MIEGVTKMELGNRYPEARTFMILYRMYWDEDGIRDDNVIARGIVEDQDSDEFEAYEREIREMMEMDNFPWETILDWANRDLPDENATRAWLDGFLKLINKNLTVKVQ